MRIKILCTLGPATLKKGVIRRLEDLDVDLFRLNLSHTRIEDLEDQIDFIRDTTSVPLCLDTEGAQIRTGTLKSGELEFEETDIIKIPNRVIKGTKRAFNFYPENIVEQLKVGDILSIDFNSALFQVSKKSFRYSFCSFMVMEFISINFSLNGLYLSFLPNLPPN